jgi:hypothetical protein
MVTASRVLPASLLVGVPAVLSAVVASSVTDAVCAADCLGLVLGGLVPMYVAMALIVGIAAGLLRSRLPLVGWVAGTIIGVEGASWMVGPDGVAYSIGGWFAAALHFVVFLPAAIVIAWLVGVARRRLRTP